MSGRQRDMAFVVNMSGGKDSVRMLGFLCERFPEIPKYVVMADTGFEHEKPVSAQDWARERTAAFGLELHVVKNASKTYLEMVERRGKFPAPGLRQCTSDLKRDPINTWIRRSVKSGLIKAKVIINCTGIRAEESAARSKQRPLSRNRKLSVAGRCVWNWMPIFRLSLEDVLSWHSQTATPFHPVYTYAGGYLKRFSCRLCIFATNDDLRAIHANDRESFELVAGLEERIGQSMRTDGRRLVQILAEGAQAPAQEELALC